MDIPAPATGDESAMRPVTDGGTGEPFAPIAEYGFLSDAETTALLAPSGNVEWMCLPRLDSPSVFGSLLDRDAGYFRVGPAGVDVPAARRYVPGPMVQETTWWTPGGWLVVLDTLLIGPWHHEAVAAGNGVDLRLHTDLFVGFEGSLATARTLLKQGDTRFVTLSWSEHAPPRTYDEAQRRLTWTVHHWQHWLDRGRIPDHPWRGHLLRCAFS